MYPVPSQFRSQEVSSKLEFGSRVCRMRFRSGCREIESCTGGVVDMLAVQSWEVQAVKDADPELVE